MRSSAAPEGSLVEMRLARETVQPVQFAAAIQIIGGPPPVARTFSRVPKTEHSSPRAAADPRQYFKKSLLDTFTFFSFHTKNESFVFATDWSRVAFLWCNGGANTL